MSGKRLAELSILTRDLPAAAAAWGNASGLAVAVSGGEGRAYAGDVLIRLLSSEAGASAAELVAARGEGMYELVIEVEDLVDCMANLKMHAVILSGVELAEAGRREVRIDPRSTFGVPIRLVEKK